MERARSNVYVCMLFALAAAAEEVKDFEIYWHINPGEKGDGEPVDYIRIDLLGFESDAEVKDFEEESGFFDFGLA